MATVHALLAVVFPYRDIVCYVYRMYRNAVASCLRYPLLRDAIQFGQTPIHCVCIHRLSCDVEHVGSSIQTFACRHSIPTLPLGLRLKRIHQPHFYQGDLVWYKGKRCRVWEVAAYDAHNPTYVLKTHRRYRCRRSSCSTFDGFTGVIRADDHLRCCIGRDVSNAKPVPQKELRLVQRSGLYALRYQSFRTTHFLVRSQVPNFVSVVSCKGTASTCILD